MTFVYFVESFREMFPEGADYRGPHDPRVQFFGRDAKGEDRIEITAEGRVFRNGELGEVPDDWGVLVRSTDRGFYTNKVWVTKDERLIPNELLMFRKVGELDAQLKAKGKVEVRYSEGP